MSSSETPPAPSSREVACRITMEEAVEACIYSKHIEYLAFLAPAALCGASAFSSAFSLVMWRDADWAGARQWGEGSHYQQEGWKSHGCHGEAGASGESWDSWSLACVPDDPREQNRWVDSRRTCAEEAVEWATDLRSASEWVPTEVPMSGAGRFPQCMQRMEPTLSPSGAAPSTQAYPLELRKRKRRRAAPHRAQPPVATALPPVPVCSTWGTRGGCSRGKTCPMLHVNHETGKITPTRGSGTRGDGRRAWCGPADALRRQTLRARCQVVQHDSVGIHSRHPEEPGGMGVPPPRL